MLERRTFIVRVHGRGDAPIVEDVWTGERVRLPDLASIADELRRRIHDSPGHTPLPAGQRDGTAAEHGAGP
jgi:hypothetical protein